MRTSATETPAPESARLEIKGVTDETNLDWIRSWLHLHWAGFRVAYPARQVNNLYFDTPHMRSLEENLAGISRRRKVRLRWYGQEATDLRAVFEVKCKQNTRGWKISQPLDRPIDIAGARLDAILAAIQAQLPHELRAQLDSSGSPVMVNQYQREYYVSFDDRIRATLDYSLRVYDQRCSAVVNLTRLTPVPHELVAEFKANSQHREELAEVVSELRLRVGRSSKYVLGVQTLLGC